MGDLGLQGAVRGWSSAPRWRPTGTEATRSDRPQLLPLAPNRLGSPTSPTSRRGRVVRHSVRHRPPRPQDPALVGGEHDDQPAGARGRRASDLDPTPRGQGPGGVIAHHNHGSQYLSVAYSEWLDAARITPSTGAVGFLLRQRPSRVGHRPGQDRTRQATRSLERPRRPRDRHRPVGRTGCSNRRPSNTATTSKPPRLRPLTTLTTRLHQPLESQTGKSPNIPGRFLVCRRWC
jgi:hypothetical protein